MRPSLRYALLLCIVVRQTCVCEEYGDEIVVAFRHKTNDSREVMRVVVVVVEL